MSKNYANFSTKAYTLTTLIDEVAALPKNADIVDVIEALSPRAGVFSRKLVVIDTFLNGALNNVLFGTADVAGASARTRLLNALKFRKTNGYFYF